MLYVFRSRFFGKRQAQNLLQQGTWITNPLSWQLSFAGTLIIAFYTIYVNSTYGPYCTINVNGTYLLLYNLR